MAAILATFPSMMERDRKREGFRFCRAAWLIEGVRMTACAGSLRSL